MAQPRLVRRIIVPASHLNRFSDNKTLKRVAKIVRSLPLVEGGSETISTVIRQGREDQVTVHVRDTSRNEYKLTFVVNEHERDCGDVDCASQKPQEEPHFVCERIRVTII